MNKKKLAVIDQKLENIAKTLDIFPISNMGDLNKYFQKDYYEETGIEDNRNIWDIANGKRSGDLEEEIYCQKIIEAMKEGKFTSPEEYKKIVTKFGEEIF